MKSIQIIENIMQIYDRYRVPPNLIEHMLKVGAVANLILENWKGKKIKKEDCLASALLHDIGNIVKINFKSELTKKMFKKLPKKEIGKYEEIQKEYIKKYGKDAETANIKIVEEIGANKKVIKILKEISLRRKTSILDIIGGKKSMEAMICKYSDLRVSPFKVVPLKERLKEASKRYVFDLDKEIKKGLAMEKIIFENVKIKPEDISEKSIQRFLKRYLKKPNYL